MRWVPAIQLFAALSATACGPGTEEVADQSGQSTRADSQPLRGSEEQVFELGRDEQLRVRIPAVQKGLGSTPESLNVVFTNDELRLFLGVSELPLPPSALRKEPMSGLRGELGTRLEEGSGVPRDLEGAERLYARAASDSDDTIHVYSPPAG